MGVSCMYVVVYFEYLDTETTVYLQVDYARLQYCCIQISIHLNPRFVVYSVFLEFRCRERYPPVVLQIGCAWYCVYLDTTIFHSFGSRFQGVFRGLCVHMARFTCLSLCPPRGFDHLCPRSSGDSTSNRYTVTSEALLTRPPCP